MSGKQQSLLARLGISVLCSMAHLGRTWEHLTWYRSGDSNAKSQLVVFWKCYCKYSTSFFLFFRSYGSPEKKKKQLSIITFIQTFFTGSCFVYHPWDMPSLSFKAPFYVPLLCYQAVGEGDKVRPQAKQVKGEGGRH